jgi:hypothetical protein
MKGDKNTTYRTCKCCQPPSGTKARKELKKIYRRLIRRELKKEVLAYEAA